MSLPTGTFYVDSTGYTPVPFQYANMYIFNNTPVIAHEATNTIGLFSVGDILDSSRFGDRSLSNRLFCRSMDAMIAQNAVMSYCGGGNFVNIV
ncbi:MAG: hypothetical protein K6E29_06035 [Cyanobacteria bacterium RUI128]|nr:hypothetical protein [Cyanobacteria bacterium RUI128]